MLFSVESAKECIKTAAKAKLRIARILIKDPWPVVVVSRGTWRFSRESCLTQSCSRGWKLRLTFRLGNYTRSFPYTFEPQMKDIWTLRPGPYSEFSLGPKQQQVACLENDSLSGPIVWKTTLRAWIHHYRNLNTMCFAKRWHLLFL